MAVLDAARASYRQMYQGQPGTAISTLYTSPNLNANVTTPSAPAVIKSIILANTTANAATITLHNVPAGGTAAAGTQIVPGVSVAANDVKILDGLNIGMNSSTTAGATIQGLQGTASAITVTISGDEVQ